MKKLALLLPLLALIGCAPNHVRNAYIDPHGNCGYVVMIGGFDGKDIELSKCMTLENARDLAETINKDMAGKWSAAQQ